ncbi:MAG TPA: ABC transporter permease [Kofleriaceae bacterium]|jgi:putative ABC transport system permease protein|nr:ABC transporter permease [Kofleriaceae bacterium]
MLFFHYVARKLIRRIGNNAITIIVIGFVLTGCMLGVSFLLGLRNAASESFPPEHIIVTTPGAIDEATGQGITQDTVRQIAVLPGIRGGDKKAVSPELVARTLLDPELTASGIDEQQNVRGVEPIAYELHGVKIVEGRMPAEGAPEMIVGVQARKRHPGLKLGAVVKLPQEDWTVVGYFSAGGSTYENELWADRLRVSKPLKLDRINSLMIAASSTADAASLIAKINDSKAFEASAKTEREFRGSQAQLAQVTKIISLLVLILCVIGVFVTATNLHASLITRMPEFASLITLGVRRNRVAGLVLAESLLLSLTGAAIAVGLALLANGTSSAAISAMAAFDLKVGLIPIGFGVGLALVIGLIGGMFPSLIVKRLDLIRGLR